MTFNTDFSYAWGKPIAAGIIKSNPEDFQVIEIPDFNLCGTGEHVYLKIRKIGTNTGWVASQLAEYAGISAEDIGYAGRKDRNAVTEQWFSCYLPGERNITWKDLAIDGVQLLEVTRHSKKLRKGELAGNQFTIIVRNTSGSQLDRDAMEKSLRRVRDSGAPNYFGEQRFGRGNNNLEFADKLLKGCRNIRRNRDIYLSAARSYMFNHFLSSKIDKTGWKEISPMEIGPLYGMSRDPREGEDSLPEECLGWCVGLQSLRIKSGARNLMLQPKNLQWQFGDDRLQITFTLSAGSFATSLLREVLDYSESARG